MSDPIINPIYNIINQFPNNNSTNIQNSSYPPNINNVPFNNNLNNGQINNNSMRNNTNDNNNNLNNNNFNINSFSNPYRENNNMMNSISNINIINNNMMNNNTMNNNSMNNNTMSNNTMNNNTMNNFNISEKFNNNNMMNNMSFNRNNSMNNDNRMRFNTINNFSNFNINNDNNRINNMMNQNNNSNDNNNMVNNNNNSSRNNFQMNNIMNNNNSMNNILPINNNINPPMTNTMFANNNNLLNNNFQNNNNLNSFNFNSMLENPFLANSMQIPSIPNFSTFYNPPFMPFYMNNNPFNLNRNINPQMSQNFNNFNFIRFNDNLSRRNRRYDSSSRIQDDDSDEEIYLNSGNRANNDNYNKLKKQFIKELDEFQYKNKDKFDNELVEDECSICLCKYKITDIIKLLPCKHPFHKKCIKKWFSKEENNKCPLCNLDIKDEIMKMKTELEKHIYDEEHEDNID